MAETTLYVRALVRVAKLLGGAEALAKHLCVPQARLQRYLQDDERMPEALFLKVVDVLVEDEIRKLRRERLSGGDGRKDGSRKSGNPAFGAGNRKRV